MPETEVTVNCRICQCVVQNPFAKSILLGRDVQYFDCPACGYVQTENPTWLQEAYSSSINASDTGIMARNLSNVSLVLATLALMQERNSEVVDYAGGYGFLVRLLRDAGVDAFWVDPYSENLVARGFEYAGRGQAALVTAFEAFEHFSDPCDEMSKLLRIAPNILLTTNIIPRPAPHPTDWWYYGLDHGQHIGFFRVKTLQYIADKFGLQLMSDGVSTHFYSRRRYSPRIWRILKRLAKHAPSIFSVGLLSKTWTDHLSISRAGGVDS